MALDPTRVGRIADQLLSPSVSRDWDVVRHSDRGTVLRADGLIAKHHGDRGEAFEVEAEALKYANRWVPDLAPELFALSNEQAVLVMADLGKGRSMADALLGGDSEEAIRYLDTYADAVARLHEVTWESESTPRALPHDRTTSHHTLFGKALGRIRKREDLGDKALRLDVVAEIAPLARLATNSGPTVFTPGDMCPDNQIMTDAGLKLFDFEAAGFMHPAIDVSYLTIPFPSCWCAWDLPADVRQRALDRYLDQTTRPESVREALPDAHAFWTAITAVGSLNIGSAGPLRPDIERANPGYRAVVVHRIDRTRTNSGVRTRLPAFCALLDELRANLDNKWGAPSELQLAPAFRAPRRQT